MEKEKKIGYWRIFSELFWAAFKALILIALVLAIKTGFIFSTLELSKGVLDSFGGSLLMYFLGSVLFLPALLVFALLVATPLALLIYKENWWSIYVLTMSGALISVVFIKWLPLLLNQDTFSYKYLISDNINYLLAGGLTGYFLFKQIGKEVFQKEEK